MARASRSSRRRRLVAAAGILQLARTAEGFQAQSVSARERNNNSNSGSGDGETTSSSSSPPPSSRERARTALSMRGLGRPAVPSSSPLRGTLADRGRARNGRGRGISDDSAASAGDFALRMSKADGSGDADENDTLDPSRTKLDASRPPPSRQLADEGDEERTYQRRAFLSSMLAATAGATTAALSDQTDAAWAYEQAYPVELTGVTPYDAAETSANSLSKLKAERAASKRAQVESTRDELRNDPLGLGQSTNSGNFGLTIAGATTWGLALWFASGSRSNPVVTPVANALYDEDEEDWLADRNAGYFSELPLSLTAILSAVFVFLGVLLDRGVYFLADGDAEVSLQLAGVSAISAGFWEVGRLAAREKAPTRVEYERDELLASEFEDFAARRLVVGRGSCHRSDVIGAFRRYNPKYRTADSESYPLGDLEIERLLRDWARRSAGLEMSSAGFFNGVFVDGAADAFRPR